MDKEQTRLLILVLAGILFFGQAVYDHFKKRRRQNSHTRRTSTTARSRQPRRQTTFDMAPLLPRTTGSVSTTPRPVFVIEPKKDMPAAEQPLSSCDRAADSDKAEDSPEISAHSEDTSREDISREELRRAVIWSEILKRKF